MSSPEYLHNAERILKELVRSGHRIVRASLRGNPVYIVTDMSLAKQIFEDARNFSFSPNPITEDDSLTDGVRAFIREGLESPLVSSSYDDYREIRNLFNQAFRHCVTNEMERIRALAKKHIATLLDGERGEHIDALALSRNYWLPLAADVIGLGSLSLAELHLLGDSARVLVEANGLHGDAESVKALAGANKTLIDAIQKVIDAGAAPHNSALGYLLEHVGPERALDVAFSFVLGGIDTGSSALALQTHLLAVNPDQREHFITLSETEQQNALTELASKESPTYYTLRFAVRDTRIDDFDIPAGSFLHLALYSLNNCANPDFDIRRDQPSACPAHRNETLPFGHARHRCPGETLARYLMPVFLNALFSRYGSVTVVSYKRLLNNFARSVSELILQVAPR